MALSRRGGRARESQIWPGFVDAMTALLLVLMFVLTIFLVVQSVLRDTITSQGSELDMLGAEVSSLADALGLERSRADQLGTDLAAAQAESTQQALLAATLTTQLAATNSRIASFEQQVASLLAERDAAQGQLTTLTATKEELEAANRQLVTDQEALNLALARAREEVDAEAEAARLAAARREAIEAMVADLRTRAEQNETRAANAQAALNEAEQNRLVDAAAAEALRARLANSQAELTAMSLSLEEQRKEAERTLTLLAAAQTDAARAARGTTRQGDLLATAEAALAQERERSTQSERQTAVLNQQIAALRSQLGALQGVLDARSSDADAAQVQVDDLGNRLNVALAQVADEQRRRAELEEAERQRLEDEAVQLERYRSEFFGQLRGILGDREGVRIVGDRFVFSSEVLFNVGSADLSPAGQEQIAGVATILRDVSDQIPENLDWILRVDGHTDDIPLSGTGEFADNWELSQARALSVVRFMQDSLGFPPDRLAPTGFGQYRPVVEGTSAEARAQNRRIELKLTER